jgi:hypothetical protein
MATGSDHHSYVSRIGLTRSGQADEPQDEQSAQELGGGTSSKLAN